MALEFTNVPGRNRAIGKKECTQSICIEDTDTLIDIGLRAVVVTGWVVGDVGATGVYLNKAITQGTTNSGTEFDGTFAGFETWFQINFPEYVNADFIIIIDGTVRQIAVIFPEVGVIPNFIFSPNAIANGAIASVENQGAFPDLENCHYQVRMYDFGTNEELCVLDEQEAKFSDTVPVTTIETCFSQWDAGQYTTLPTLNSINVEIDPNYCKNIYFRVWKMCEQPDGCFEGESLITTQDIAVFNSCLKDNSSFDILDNLNTGLAQFPTERFCVKICPGVQDWQWICPNLKILDDFNLTYTYVVRFTYYDRENNQLNTTQSLVGNTNEAFIIPTGYNAGTPVNPLTSYYTVEFLVNVNGGQFLLTQPVIYQLDKCCCDQVIYFLEDTGGYSPLCFVKSKSNITNKSQEICIESCECEPSDTASEKSETLELELFCDDDDTLKSFAKATKHYVLRGDEFKSISIKEKNIDYEIFEGIPNVSIIAKISC